MRPPPPTSTLFPYTTLFRSLPPERLGRRLQNAPAARIGHVAQAEPERIDLRGRRHDVDLRLAREDILPRARRAPWSGAERMNSQPLRLHLRTRHVVQDLRRPRSVRHAGVFPLRDLAVAIHR